MHLFWFALPYILVAAGGFLLGTVYGRTVSQEALDELHALRKWADAVLKDSTNKS